MPNKQPFKVRVISYTHVDNWYARRHGEVFEVVDFTPGEYAVLEPENCDQLLAGETNVNCREIWCHDAEVVQ